MTSSSPTVRFGQPRNRFAKSLSFGLTDILLSNRRIPFALLDLALAFSLFMTAVWLSPFGKWGKWTGEHMVAAGVFSVIFCLMAIGLGYYDRTSRYHAFSVFTKASIATVVAAAGSLSAIYFLFYGGAGRLTIAYGVGASFVGLTLVRILLGTLSRRHPYRFTIIGSSPQLDEIIAYCSNGGRGSRVYSYVRWEEIFPPGVTRNLDLLLASRVGEVVLTSEAMQDLKTIDFAMGILQAKVMVIDEVTFYSQVFGRLPVDAIDKVWVLREGIARRQIIATAFKRWIDIFLALVAMILIAPFVAVMALLIKLDDGGPVLFVQQRQGRYFKPFRMFKFRTMTVREAASTAADGFTQKHDPRVTRVGRILRPLHLDELPQLLNILLGHMSIVGPRPEALEFSKKMRDAIPLYEIRYLVRPGLTGYAQINQGYALDNVEDTKKKLSYDLFYLCRYSLGLDLHIILRTVFVLAKGAR